MRFVADAMLGRLVRWLRVLGFDTHYRSFDPVHDIAQMAQRGWIPLTRQRKMIPLLEDAVLIRHNGIGEQLTQLKKTLLPETCHVNWFSRCLLCNVLLMDAPEDAARDNIPEYVFYENINSIRFCPTCGRYFWPGSHRARMEKQLNSWGFTQPFS
ncbi:MAG: hypothetical protein GY846_00305 [Deltaproteobacteria bacterium]|nr:hypothetical protein [Deltaproteobacteria bacterium]